MAIHKKYQYNNKKNSYNIEFSLNFLGKLFNQAE